MYIPTNGDSWTGRVDPSLSADTMLWHQLVKLYDMKESVPEAQPGDVGFLGYRSDEGVRRNYGRIGAKEGPGLIRKAMSGFAAHFDTARSPLADFGDVITEDDKLEISQEELATHVKVLLDKGYFPVVLGGGHEIAYGHYRGVREHVGEASVGIVNLDAHFDMRPYPEGSHSGSPFRQILDDCRDDSHAFHYLPIGINPAANQRALFMAMDEVGQRYITQEQIRWDAIGMVRDQLQTFADKVDHIYLTLDLDVIPGAFAPGVSAPAAFGVDPNLIREIIRLVFETGKVISFDIAEMNPMYDDGRTAKLAASFVYDIVQRFCTGSVH